MMMNINAIIAQFDLQTRWFLNALESISEEESNATFAENLNPVKWVVGHLTYTRMTILGIISDKEVNGEYKRLFDKGTSNKIDDSFPVLEQIKSEWATVSKTLKTALQMLST